MLFRESTDWLGRVFHPIAARFMKAAGESPTPQTELAEALLAGRALGQAPLEAAFQQIFYFAYPYDHAYDLAHASATDFAAKNNTMITDHFGTAEAYATYYAETNTEANRSFATTANARVHARLTAAALAQQNDTALAASGSHFRTRALRDALQSLASFMPALLPDLNTLNSAVADAPAPLTQKGEKNG